MASLTSALVEAAEVQAGVPDPHVGGRVAELVAGVAAEVLVGEEQHLGPRPLLPSAQVSTARALDEVHTAPPWRPTNAFRAAEEFM